MLTSLTVTPASFLYCDTSFFQPASWPGTVEIQNVSDLEFPPEPDPDPQADRRRTDAVASAAAGARRRSPTLPGRRERRAPTQIIFDPFVIADGARRRPLAVAGAPFFITVMKYPQGLAAISLPI
jgi:hypothetical protein